MNARSKANEYINQSALQFLDQFIKSQGFKIKYRTKYKLDCGGYFDLLKKEIYIFMNYNESKDLISIRDFAFLLAHESRHLMHTVLGLYCSYYNIEFYRYYASPQWSIKKNACRTLIPCPNEALGAERDCDKWAEDFVRNNIDETFINKNEYKLEDIFCYKLYSKAR